LRALQADDGKIFSVLSLVEISTTKYQKKAESSAPTTALMSVIS
jgi:hypothetical protein